MNMDPLEQWLSQLPAMAQQHRAELAGRSGLFRVETKQGRRRDILLEDGQVQVMEVGEHTPVCTISADEKDLLDMLGGRLNLAKALLFGKVKVKGDPKPLLALVSLLK